MTESSAVCVAEDTRSELGFHRAAEQTELAAARLVDPFWGMRLFHQFF
jgi:hypothetical protein